MKTKILLCALVAAAALSSCTKENNVIGNVPCRISFEPSEITVPGDGQFHEVTVNAPSDVQYQFFARDEVFDYVSIPNITYSAMSGTYTLQIGSGYKGRKKTVSISAVAIRPAGGSATLKITVGE